jgi:hypothetical protein
MDRERRLGRPYTNKPGAARRGKTRVANFQATLYPRRTGFADAQTSTATMDLACYAKLNDAIKVLH